VEAIGVALLTVSGPFWVCGLITEGFFIMWFGITESGLDGDEAFK
jgi:hypothetical protein